MTSYTLLIITDIATIISALGTIAAVIFFALQVMAARAQTFGDMAVTLHDEFFSKYENPKIVRAIERDTLAIKPGGPIFPQGLFMDKPGTIAVDEEDIDDYLGIIELIHELLRKRCLTKEYVKLLFGNYIVNAWDNTAVREYIDGLRTETGKQYYEAVRLLADQCRD